MLQDTKKIVKFCEEYLNVENFNDYCVNGLQVEGADKVSKIITGVSLSQDLIKVAIKKRAKVIMVHHGLFKDLIGTPPQIKGVTKNRLKMLLENNINLMGFHLPLDAHPEIGNNISILNLLGLKKLGTITEPAYGEIGFFGELKEAVNFNEFVNLVNEKINTNSYTIAAGPKKVKTIGIISGGASPSFEIAADLGCDTFICGDVREQVVRAVEEKKINFINAGHYNTEVFGIKNLGELVSKKFKVPAEFIDVPCEV